MSDHVGKGFGQESEVEHLRRLLDEKHEECDELRDSIRFPPRTILLTYSKDGEWTIFEAGKSTGVLDAHEALWQVSMMLQGNAQFGMHDPAADSNRLRQDLRVIRREWSDQHYLITAQKEQIDALEKKLAATTAAPPVDGFDIAVAITPELIEFAARLQDVTGFHRTAAELALWPDGWRVDAENYLLATSAWGESHPPSMGIGFTMSPKERQELEKWRALEPQAPWFMTGRPDPDAAAAMPAGGEIVEESFDSPRFYEADDTNFALSVDAAADAPVTDLDALEAAAAEDHPGFGIVPEPLDPARAVALDEKWDGSPEARTDLWTWLEHNRFCVPREQFCRWHPSFCEAVDQHRRRPDDYPAPPELTRFKLPLPDKTAQQQTAGIVGASECADLLVKWGDSNGPLSACEARLTLALWLEEQGYQIPLREILMWTALKCEAVNRAAASPYIYTMPKDVADRTS